MLQTIALKTYLDMGGKIKNYKLKSGNMVATTPTGEKILITSITPEPVSINHNGSKVYTVNSNIDVYEHNITIRVNLVLSKEYTN